MTKQFPPLVSAASSLEEESTADPRIVDVLVALGEMARATKKNGLAADYLLRALKAAEELNPQDTTRLRNSLVSLGSLYLADRPSDALPLLERASLISEKYEDKLLHAIDQDNLAVAYQATKDYRRASILGLQALETINSIPSVKNASATKGTVLHNLGYTYMEMGLYKEAEEKFRESLIALQSNQKDIELWRVKTVKNSYAELLRRLGRTQDAELQQQNRADAL